MRVLPILFNTDMVRAILDGRKTVTRRICKDGNEFTVPDMGYYDTDKRTYAVHNYANAEHTEKLSIAERKCPISPGDILYVRETWAINPRPNMYSNYYYKANRRAIAPEGTKWHPSIHMPKEAARIFLKVKDVHVERLQDITEEQAVKEGCKAGSKEYHGAVWGQEDYEEWTAIDDFVDVWSSTIKKADIDKYGWKANPWVWVIEFERCEKQENF